MTPMTTAGGARRNLRAYPNRSSRPRIGQIPPSGAKIYSIRLAAINPHRCAACRPREGGDPRTIPRKGERHAPLAGGLRCVAGLCIVNFYAARRNRGPVLARKSLLRWALKPIDQQSLAAPLKEAARQVDNRIGPKSGKVEIACHHETAGFQFLLQFRQKSRIDVRIKI